MFENPSGADKKGNFLYHGIEILKELSRPSIKAVIFDFDGTVSTLRQGWEKIMEPFMVEMIQGPGTPSEELIKEVREYIDESTGIQTIYQMQWLEEQVRRRGLNPLVHDAWWYKDEYNRRLLEMVKTRVQDLEEGRKSPDDYIIMGAGDFIQNLYDMGLALYVASGTDHKDVVREAASLGLKGYFTQIMGAPERRADCSKEAVFRLLIETKGIKGEELLVVGDGKVEIALGVELGALTLGVAADEIKRHGLNPAKRNRLIKAGAHVIIEDFLPYREILSILFPDSV
ncbi:MAG: HAD family hydrolase [Caldicoprobacterales bacterium]|jgi:phosphoglycolate phosphatase-like HAD superfamily hydrolase|nr:HAD family hydrolase [Clostridiales bacterium]